MRVAFKLKRWPIIQTACAPFRPDAPEPILEARETGSR
jgi:hypothetical protein